MRASEDFLSTYEAEEQRKLTGYTWNELEQIEYAFENPSEEPYSDMALNGLLSVVDVLAQIHNMSLEQTQQAKSLFVK